MAAASHAIRGLQDTRSIRSGIMLPDVKKGKRKAKARMCRTGGRSSRAGAADGAAF
jgi:hypothetical protein